MNGKEKLVDTVSETTTDKEGNICFHYAFVGGVKYIIKVYCNSLTSGTYTFTAEQDNWVYAPYVGYSNCALEKSNHDCSSYYRVYFSDAVINEIMRRHFVESGIIKKGENIDPPKDEATWLAQSDEYADQLMEYLNDGNKDKFESVLQNISNGTSLTGVVLLFYATPEGKILSAICTKTGHFASDLYWIDSNMLIYNVTNGKAQAYNFDKGEYINFDSYCNEDEYSYEFDKNNQILTFYDEAGEELAQKQWTP